MRRSALVMSLLLLPALGLVQGKSNKQPVVPAVFRSAHFVYVEAMDGDVTRPGLLPDDRNAVLDVQDRIQAWGRYVLVYDRQKADLVFIVRKGRVATGTGRVGITDGQRPMGQPPSHNPVQVSTGSTDPTESVGGGFEVGPADDMLTVYTVNNDGKLLGPVWKRSLPDGLSDPQVPLFQQVKDAVEQTYPIQASKQTGP